MIQVFYNEVYNLLQSDIKVLDKIKAQQIWNFGIKIIRFFIF